MAKKRGVSFAKVMGGGFVAVSRALSFPFGRRIRSRALAYVAATVPPLISVSTPHGTVRFWCASASAAKRSVGFMGYEPDTRDWIDANIKPGDHLWDVGANIGAFTLYSCLREGVTATSFEPVAGTFAILAHNLAANGLSERVTPLCMALSNADGVVPIFLASTEPGESMHALSAPTNVRATFEPQGRQNILAMRGDDIVTRLGLQKPDHIKIDVDGHELRVLEGLETTLGGVRTLWVEMITAADATGENARIDTFLRGRGFEQRALATGTKGRNRLYVNLSKGG